MSSTTRSRGRHGQGDAYSAGADHIPVLQRSLDRSISWCTLVIHTAGFNEKTFHRRDRCTAYRRDEHNGAHPPDQARPSLRTSSPFTILNITPRDLQARFVYTLRNDVRLEDYVCGEPIAICR